VGELIKKVSRSAGKRTGGNPEHSNYVTSKGETGGELVMGSVGGKIVARQEEACENSRRNKSRAEGGGAEGALGIARLLSAFEKGKEKDNW